MTAYDELLHEYLRYDSESGFFYWRKTILMKSKVPLVNAGDIAGTKDQNGYIRIALKGKRHLAHRLAWFMHFGKWPNKQIDHVDRDKQNNSIANLRLATALENQRNRGFTRSNTSGFIGVSFHKRHGTWMARIKIKRQLIHLGCFKTAEEGGQAYLAARAQHFGEFGGKP